MSPWKNILSLKISILSNLSQAMENPTVYLNYLPSGWLPPTFRALLPRAGLLAPRDIVHPGVAARRPDQAHLDVTAVAAHATHVKIGLGSLAPARTSPDVGFNERSLLSFIIPHYAELGRGLSRRGPTSAVSPKASRFRDVLPYVM